VPDRLRNSLTAFEAFSYVCLQPIADICGGCDCAPVNNRQFQCCYCGKEVGPADRAALRITITGLWSSSDGAVQDLYAHSKCAADKLAGNFSQWVPFDVEAFGTD
jgi:hypothetical protein